MNSTEDQQGFEFRCKVCGPSKAKLAFEGYGFDDSQERFRVMRCEACGLGMTEPMPCAKTMMRYYPQAYYGSSERKFTGPIERLVRVANRRHAKFVARQLEVTSFEGKKILDIGCGRGNFLKEMLNVGFECTGLELPGFFFPEAPLGMTFLSGVFDELKLPQESFDLITIWHVLEHSRTPEEMIASANKLLKPKGVLVIAVPNFGSVQSRIFGPNWFHLDLPRHLFHFSEKSLRCLLLNSGFEVLSKRTRSLEQNLFGFIQSALNKMPLGYGPNFLYGVLKRAGRNQLLAPLRGAWFILQAFLAVPLLVLSVLEELFCTALGVGASLILVARKTREASRT